VHRFVSRLQPSSAPTSPTHLDCALHTQPATRPISAAVHCTSSLQTSASGMGVVVLGLLVVVVVGKGVGDGVVLMQSKPRGLALVAMQCLNSAFEGSILMSASQGFGSPHGSFKALHTLVID
jgi:hypothetical protein